MTDLLERTKDMNALPTRKQQDLVDDFHAPQPASMLDIISRAASDPTMDVEKLERLLALAERQRAQEGEQKFNAAMNQAQSDIRPIAADANNPQTKSKYASYLALDRALRPIYVKHGFSLSFDTGDGPPDMVRVVCYLSHSEGHSRTYHVDMPSDGKGAKGGDVMTKTHATGAAMSYGQRYLLKMIFNIAVGEDRDGNDDDTGGKITADQVATIRGLIDRTDADIEKVCGYFKIEALPDLAAKDYDRCIGNLNLREKKMQAAK